MTHYTVNVEVSINAASEEEAVDIVTMILEGEALTVKRAQCGDLSSHNVNVQGKEFNDKLKGQGR